MTTPRAGPALGQSKGPIVSGREKLTCPWDAQLVSHKLSDLAATGSRGIPRLGTSFGSLQLPVTRVTT